ncbi:LiaI-LiaF-like domain-containing protein [uncultured Clostridium sp.]|uniref:LiaI-LiaF-like domain-containing protein n=1 Tax=uncultured Clostridium sp. TaxID=59620 RepID=UPI0028E3D75D|nr:DUF5668 domain-containing protein [uncultured Clostridium sp.]
MRKVGTITSSVGFIFIGIWLMLRNFSYDISVEMIKWWPVLIILFGAEIIILNNMKRENEKVGFNFLIIPLTIIFIGINSFVFVESKIPKDSNIFKDGLSVVFDDIDFTNNERGIKTEKVLEPFGKKIVFDTNNADIEVKKSEDGKVRLELNVYVNKNDKRDSYEIKENKLKDGYEFSITESSVKGVSGEIYIPENMDIDIKANNLKFDSEDYKTANSLKIDCNNAGIHLGDSKNLNIKANNGLIEGANSNVANVIMNNGKVSFNGDVREGTIKVNNGEINVDNKQCKDLNIDMNLGSVNINTSDNNLTAALKINQGKIRLNDEDKVNSNLSKTLGNGAGKLNVDVKIGSIDIETGEW